MVQNSLYSCTFILIFLHSVLHLPVFFIPSIILLLLVGEEIWKDKRFLVMIFDKNLFFAMWLEMKFFSLSYTVIS